MKALRALRALQIFEKLCLSNYHQKKKKSVSKVSLVKYLTAIHCCSWCTEEHANYDLPAAMFNKRLVASEPNRALKCLSREINVMVGGSEIHDVMALYLASTGWLTGWLWCRFPLTCAILREGHRKSSAESGKWRAEGEWELNATSPKFRSARVKRAWGGCSPLMAVLWKTSKYVVIAMYQRRKNIKGLLTSASKYIQHMFVMIKHKYAQKHTRQHGNSINK